MQHCGSECGHCARAWWKWLKAREHQMNTPHRNNPGPVTFAQAAATSVKPEAPACHSCGVAHDPTLAQRGCHPITHGGAMYLVNGIREFLLGAAAC